jgi:hypothetical protein
MEVPFPKKEEEKKQKREKEKQKGQNINAIGKQTENKIQTSKHQHIKTAIHGWLHCCCC